MTEAPATTDPRADIVCDVAIVGAGPTGLAIANLLGKAGVDTLVLEKNPTTVQMPRAVSIDDESLRTLQACDLGEQVIANVALDYGAHYFTPSGVCFAKVEAPANEYGYPRRNAFLQPVLEATMREGAARFASVRMLFEHECMEFAEDDAGVSIIVRKPDGGQMRVRASYVAGCDGARSMLRKHIGAKLEGETYEEKWLIVDLADTKERFRQTRVLCDPERPTICLPGPDGKRRYEFMLRKGERDEDMENPIKVRELLLGAGPDADAPVVRRQVYTFHARICDTWSSRRIFLAGDAAHLTPPFAGQGMNSGMRDAHALSWRLIAATKGALGRGVFGSYRQERAPHARALIDMAINIGKVMMPTSHLQAFFVHNAFRLMRFIPPLHAYFAQMKYKPKPYYDEGFIIEDPNSKLVGRMMYQPWVEMRDRSRRRLDDLLGDGFALVAYGEHAQERIATSATYDFGLGEMARVAISPMRVNIDRTQPESILAVRDTADQLAQILDPKAETLLLVRPDRYIMAAIDARNADAIRKLAQDVRELVASTFH